MKRVLTIVIAAAVLFGLAAAPVSAAAPLVFEGRSASLANVPRPDGLAAAIHSGGTIAPVKAPAVFTVGGCALTMGFPPNPGNGLWWSNNYGSWRTPMLGAGSCNSIYIHTLGVTNTTSGCVWLRVDTHNDDGSRRVRGPWIQANYNQYKLMRHPVDTGRLFIALAYSCSHRDSTHVPGLNVYAY